MGTKDPALLALTDGANWGGDFTFARRSRV
jgi:hypothetical protein